MTLTTVNLTDERLFVTVLVCLSAGQQLRMTDVERGFRRVPVAIEPEKSSRSDT